MKKTVALLVGLGATILIGAGCETLMGEMRNHHTSSLYAYLYSDEKGHVDTPAIPVLSLPLRVGVAFVPMDSRGTGSYACWDELRLPESEKIELMKNISEQFKKYPFVKSIDLIPSTYLCPRGGFANLDQIRAMYGVDVMVLLSYDQVQYTGDSLLSLSYLTIIGAYTIPAEKNDTKTMVDAAVFDIASRKLLFRAPGIGNVTGHSRPIVLDEQLREDSTRGFQMATTNLAANLQVELADFRDNVSKATNDYKIVYKPGYTGSGAFGGFEALLVVGLAACFLCTRQNFQSGPGVSR